MTSPSFFCSTLKFHTSQIPYLPIPSPKISSLNNPFLKIKIPPRNYIPLVSVNSSSDSSIAIEENNPPAGTSLKSDESTFLDEEDEKALAKVGSKVKVKVPLKVYHVPKVPEIEINGNIGVFKQYVAIHKGKRISANLPYKVEFVAENVEGRSGPVKFFVHLKEDEFEYIS